MKKFLKYIKETGINNGIFVEDIVSNFPDAEKENFKICNFKGINGDLLKDKFYKKYYKNKPKSCDVIKILENRIDFIEFKTLYIGDIKNINTKVNEFELTKKLEDSYDLLKKIINEDIFNFENKNILIIKVLKQFYISIHLHGIDAKNKFILLSNIKKINRNLEGYFRNHPMPFGENFLEPKFKKTEELNDIYYNL